MTPIEEATFIALWTQGLEIAAIAQRLGISKGTVQSRAHRLQQRGLIRPRPKGGAYPRQKALARQEAEGPPSTVHPATVDRPPSTVHPASSTMDPLPSTVNHFREDLQAALTIALQPVLARLEALETGLARPRPDDRPPSTLPPWTVHPPTVHRPPWTLIPGS